MNTIQHRTFVAMLLALILLPGCKKTGGASPQSSEPSLQAAEKVYFQFDLAGATAIFESVRSDASASDKDRAEAGRRLARIAALFDRDLPRARRVLTQAELIGVDTVDTLLTLGRIEREGGNYQAAFEAASRAAALATTAPEHLEAATELAAAELARAKQAVFGTGALGLEPERIASALDEIHGVLAQRRGLLRPSLIQLELAILLGDGPKALEAWNSYFHVAPGSLPTGILSEPARSLNRHLPEWHGADLDPAARTDLAVAFAGSRLFDAAALIASLDPSGTSVSSPRVAELVAYRDYLSAVDERTVAFYLASTAGTGDQGAYVTDIEALSRSLWPRLLWPDEPPPFSQAAFESEIDRRFGAQMSLDTANGYFGLQLGHRVIDQESPVEQYGKRAALRFIALDSMLSNGYTSWFWDGRAEIGGWADNPVITQVRPAYVGAGVRAWETLTDPKLRAEVEAEIAELEPKDLDLARADPHAFLPGLARRIELRAHRELLDQLEGRSLAPSELRLAFVAEIERIDSESSIFAHEGRHAIDAQSLRNLLRRPAEREFRAKLSEVAFSSAPFLALGGGILSRNIGDRTPHGHANRRVMEGLVEWMDDHRGAITGLDSDLPLLPQLDRLTPEQLKTAVRSMDPLAS